MLSQKLEKKRPGILREEAVQKIYLNQFLAEFDTIDPYFFVDAFPGIFHKKFVSEFRISQVNSQCQIHTEQIVLILDFWSIEINLYKNNFIFSTLHRSINPIPGNAR